MSEANELNKLIKTSASLALENDLMRVEYKKLSRLRDSMRKRWEETHEKLTITVAECARLNVGWGACEARLNAANREIRRLVEGGNSREIYATICDALGTTLGDDGLLARWDKGEIDAHDFAAAIDDAIANRGPEDVLDQVNGKSCLDCAVDCEGPGVADSECFIPKAPSAPHPSPAEKETR